MSLSISEIFYSIQGESLYSGMPCLFIRLSGCNLRCSYCDTLYAYENGTETEISEILAQIALYASPLVEITGGEPLLQPETPLLITNLLEHGYNVIMETNGSFDISKTDPRCVKIMDVKCPDSHESHQNDLENLKRLSLDDQVKFVISSRKDYEYARDMVLSRCRHIASDHILFSPVFNQITPERLAEWILAEQLQVRLNLQLHKLIWSHAARGV